MKAIFASILCLLCFFSSEQVAAMEKSFRVLFPKQPKKSPQEVYLFDGSTSHKIPLPGMNFSGVMKLPEGNLQLSMTADPVTDPAAVPKDAPQTNIPADMTNFYLVVLSDPANTALPVRMLPVSAGDEQLKSGETLWMNLTGHQIEADYGETSLSIRPNQNVVGTAPLGSNGYFKAKFRYQPNGSGDFQPVMEKSWWFDSKSKNLGFVFESEIGFPQIFTFRDQRDNQPD